MPGTAQTIEDSLRSVRETIAGTLGNIDPEVFDFRRSPLSFMGKAARARFTLLAGDALELERKKACLIAAAAELTHTASLLHDDCIDLASYRRGLPTLNKELGMNAAILVGDLIVSLAFDLAAGAAPDLAPELIRAVKRMTEGALLEENARGRRLSEAEAGRITAGKTGALFRWCGLSACRLAGRPQLLEVCGKIGEEAGSAFQTIDDVIDFEGNPEDCGKETLKDIKRGNFTLPLILALNDTKAGAEAGKLLAEMKAGPDSDLAPALGLARLVKNGGFAAEARKAAVERITKLFPLIDRLPGAGGAAALRNFLVTFGERTA